MSQAEPAIEPEDNEWLEAVHPRSTCPVVGIGASAGGLDPLQRLFGAIRNGCGIAFVVVQHLNPDQPSLLPELLAHATEMPVLPIEGEATVAPDHVYVIPPGGSLTIREGTLLLQAPPAGPRSALITVDAFLTSLAQDQGHNAACIILSGTGSDGTLGVRAIKESGGLTLAQADAEYDGMMRSAVTTGLVDCVLQPEEMPSRIEAFFAGRPVPGPSLAQGSDSGGKEGLRQIYALLRTRTGHDFSEYKDSTIRRRVQRRMDMLQLAELDGFLDRLREDPREVDRLLQDLLIGVTHFFRDPEAFGALEQKVIPGLFEGKGPADTVRVWVPGCSTGEEAYSIAILLSEHAPKHESPRLQVFASDIDVRALELARVGRYPATIARDVPQARLARYFMREDGTYRVTAALRELCVFSTHNLLRDAPFSKLDLLSCRNLMIYFTGELQNRVIPLFHYALRPNGYLFIGPSENVSRHGRLFGDLDKTHGLFIRRGQSSRRTPEFPLTSPELARRRGPVAGRPHARELNLQTVVERQVLERYAPPHVVINRDGDVLLSSGRTGKYLELPAGAPDNNIFNLARPGLRLDLRAAIHEAKQTGGRVVQTKVSVNTDGGQQELDIFVEPLSYPETSDKLLMVVFQDVGAAQWSAADPADPRTDGAPLGREDDAVGLRHLEVELRATRERLQTVTEELDSSTEELKSSNEELSSMNEELQSANEELETSKEELQSINEELQTVNIELNNRVEELSRGNSDIANLLESTQIATVFLDRELAVKSFTPAAKDLFRLVESDTGRPITHVRALVELDNLQEDAERVLRTLSTVERQVHSLDGDTRYVMRMMPYRTTDNVISGIVLTFTDVTRITEAEARIQALTADLRNRVNNLETLLDLVPVGVLIAEDAHARQVVVNQYGARLLNEADRHSGLRPLEAPLRFDAGNTDEAAARNPLERAVRTGEAVFIPEARLRVGGDRSRDVMVSATPLLDERGGVRGGIAALVDISALKAAEARQGLLLHELQHRVKNILATVTALASRMTRNPAPVGEFYQAFLERLAAMGRMHDILSRHAWDGAGLRALLDAALEPYQTPGGRPPAITGANIVLRPNTATTLGLVFHELATNAAKYGALATPDGRIEVAWVLETLENGTHVNIFWTERGGRPPPAALKEGFGTSFIRRSVEYELGGEVTFELLPEGLRCRINFPSSGNVV